MGGKELLELNPGDPIAVFQPGTIRPCVTATFIAAASHPDTGEPLALVCGLPPEWPPTEKFAHDAYRACADEPERRYPTHGIHVLFADEVLPARLAAALGSGEGGKA